MSTATATATPTSVALIEAEHSILSAVDPRDTSIPDIVRRVQAGAELETLADRYRYAAWLAEQTDATWQECQCPACADVADAECPCDDARRAADARRDAAYASWLASDEERDYWCGDDSGSSWSVVARPSTVEAVIETEVREWGGDPDRTVWWEISYAPIDPYTLVADDDAEATTEIGIDPPEPECVDGEDHDWRSPHAVVGGLRENPGVWGRGCGLVMRRCCAHCGSYRVVDTSANGPSGRQGYDVTRYEDSDDASERWVRSLAEPAITPRQIATVRRAAVVDGDIVTQHACDLLSGAEPEIADDDAWEGRYGGGGHSDDERRAIIDMVADDARRIVAERARAAE